MLKRQSETNGLTIRTGDVVWSFCADEDGDGYAIYKREKGKTYFQAGDWFHFSTLVEMEEIAIRVMADFAEVEKRRIARERG